MLYTERFQSAIFDGANLVVADLAGGAPEVVVRGGYYARYLPSGHLIYMQQGTLFAIAFDLTRLETVGRAVPALDGVTANATSGGAQVAFSSDGTLVYRPGKAFSGARPIDWMTREGMPSVLRAIASDWRSPRFSPDGQKLALTISDGKQTDLWAYQPGGDRLTQLTFDPAVDRVPVWTPDGHRLVFASDRASAGISNLYSLNADGSGAVTRITESADTQEPSSWHPSGRYLAFSAVRAATGVDLMILPMEGDVSVGWSPGKPTDFLSTLANERDPMFSPDGRWIAYTSNESGQDDIYVRPFPGRGGPWRVSTGGGSFPRWSATAPELLFLGPDSKPTVVSYAVTGDSFHVENFQTWSSTSVVAMGASPYDLHPDGKRIAANASVDDGRQQQDRVVFLLNFFDHLRKIAPAAKP